MRKITTAAALIALLGACSNVPTSPSTEAVHAGPRFDGGFTMGSGNVVGPGGTPQTQTTNTQTTTTSTDVAAADSTPSRGGFTMGSGN